MFAVVICERWFDKTDIQTHVDPKVSHHVGSTSILCRTHKVNIGGQHAHVGPTYNMLSGLRIVSWGIHVNPKIGITSIVATSCSRLGVPM